MKKVVTLGKLLLLAVAGLITVAPVLFLLGGSLMGDQELAELLAPAFSDRSACSRASKAAFSSPARAGKRCAAVC